MNLMKSSFINVYLRQKSCLTKRQHTKCGFRNIRCLYAEQGWYPLGHGNVRKWGWYRKHEQNIKKWNGSVKTEVNKNWVTVRDKCPQINVQFKWHTFFKKWNGRTDGQTDKRTDGRSDYIMPQILFGGIKSDRLSNRYVIKNFIRIFLN